VSNKKVLGNGEADVPSGSANDNDDERLVIARILVLVL
jgi:hypothetical protein